MMGCARIRLSRRAQSELIAGVLVLAVLFTAVIPLMLRIQLSTLTRQENMINKAKFLQLRSEETLSISGVPETQQNLLRGIFPGIWINNTGSVPVTLHTLILINRTTGRIVSIIDLSQIGIPQTAPSIVEWAVINPGTPNPEHLVKGIYPTLQPGDSLLIKLDMTADQASNCYFRVVTARGNVLPSTGMGVAYLVPPATLAGGGAGVWRGLFYPLSGFKLIGYDQIVKSSSLTLLQGSNEIKAKTYFLTSLIWDDPQHPGLYMITLRPETNGGTLYINGRDYSDLLNSNYYLVITGFIGTYEFLKVSGFIYDYTENFIHGYFTDLYMCPVSNYDPLTSTSLKACTLEIAGNIATLTNATGLIREEDIDKNGIPELVLDTISGGNGNSDTLALRVMISRDITNADYVKVSAKITSYWLFSFTGYADLSSIRKLRIAMIAIYKFDPQSGEWVFSGYKDITFSTAKPRTFVFNAVFPVNRSNIYRVAVFLYDPYIEVYDPNTWDGGTVEFRVGLEHLLVEWGINNPYLKNTPNVYLLALPDYEAEGLGGGNDTLNMEKLLSIIENKLRSVGVNSYIVINNDTLLNNLLLSVPPKDAIVINLHGMTSPIDPTVVKDYVRNDGWIWVNIVGDPPVLPSGLIVDTSSNVTAGTGTDWNNMVSMFSLYNLPSTVWSNYSIIATGSAAPTYVFYINASVGRIVSAAWAEGKGFIVINALPPLDWTGSDPHGTDPDFDATLAVFTALYIWSLTKSG